MSEWSSIWRDTTVSASEIEVIAEDQARVAKGVNLSANKVTLDGLTCRLNANAVITSENKLGSCFDGSLPVVKLKRAAKYKEVAPGEEAILDGLKSTYAEGATFFWQTKKDSDGPSDWVAGEISKSFSFDEVGEYRIYLKIVNPDGHYAFTVRRVWVVQETQEGADPRAFFKYEYDGETLQLTFERAKPR